MDFDEYDEQPPLWGVVSPREGGGDLGLIRETLRKEQVLKYVFNNPLAAFINEGL